jgi:hypothetical protein
MEEKSNSPLNKAIASVCMSWLFMYRSN